MAEEKQIDIGPRSPSLIRALARSENDGSTVNGLPAPALGPSLGTASAPPLTQAELVQLRIRVIALESLVIALLAEAPDRQLVLAREMATYISPRPGFTPHPLTIGAANEILSLINRAAQFRANGAGSAL